MGRFIIAELYSYSDTKIVSSKSLTAPPGDLAELHAVTICCEVASNLFVGLCQSFQWCPVWKIIDQIPSIMTISHCCEIFPSQSQCCVCNIGIVMPLVARFLRSATRNVLSQINLQNEPTIQ